MNFWFFCVSPLTSSCLSWLQGTEPLVVVCETLEISLFGHCIGNRLFGGFDRSFTCEHLVNVTGIVSIAHSWLVWCRHLSSSEIRPVDISEERMAHYVRCVCCLRTQPSHLISVEQTGEKRPRLSCEMTVHIHWFVNYVVHHLLAILLVMRRPAAQHLVEESTLLHSHLVRNDTWLTRLHQSAALPWPTPWIISGARYSGVPQ